jgi:predicted SAM-dependent methyltransferase
MTKIIKKLGWLPDIIRNPLAKLRRNYLQAKLSRMQRRKLKQALRVNPVKKIIVGANDTQFDGWLPTNRDILDLLFESDWATYLKTNSLDAILAEHVWEHLSKNEAVVAAMNCFRYLKPGGYLRVAVPDGLHPNPGYIEWVRPAGKGPGSDDHKVMYTYDTFRQVFTSVGFEVSLCEYYDEHGEFHNIDWDPAEGMIRRSRRFDKLTFDRSKLGGDFDFTSIILDARKPLSPQGLKQ